jgi:ribosomal small subunit protein bTHX
MGRGDKRTAKGKRFKGSFGNSRPQKKVTKTAKPAGAADAKKEKVAKTEKAPVTVKKAPPKKAAAPKKKAE